MKIKSEIIFNESHLFDSRIPISGEFLTIDIGGRYWWHLDTFKQQGSEFILEYTPIQLHKFKGTKLIKLILLSPAAIFNLKDKDSYEYTYANGEYTHWTKKVLKNGNIYLREEPKRGSIVLTVEEFNIVHEKVLTLWEELNNEINN